jgi:hypothetical protein
MHEPSRPGRPRAVDRISQHGVTPRVTPWRNLSAPLRAWRGMHLAPFAPVLVSLALAAVLAAAPQTNGAPQRRGRTSVPRSYTRVEYKLLSPDRRGSFRTLNLERRQAMRVRAERFRKIAVDRNYHNTYVLMRNAQVTAFLDVTDPKHPDFDLGAPVDQRLASIPVEKRAHILVVPNEPREHIGKQLGMPIGEDDLEATLAIVKQARALADQLHIEHATVYVNPLDRLSVGYLHVHIVGERTGPYPEAIAGKR